MKISKILISLVFLFSLSMLSYSQKDCKVLMLEISEEYDGKCKNDLAHGKGFAKGTDTYTGRFKKGLPDGLGTYTWANGDEYLGMWEKGKRHGEGTLKYTLEEKNKKLSGIWEFDKYIGPKPKPPVVKYRKGVTRYRFTKMGNQYNRVEIKIMKGGTVNPSVDMLSINSSTGRQNGLKIEDVKFPLRVKLNYETYTSLNTSKYSVIFEFEISEPGDWLLVIYN